MMNELNDIAGQHEMIAENLVTQIITDLTQLILSLRQDRKRVRHILMLLFKAACQLCWPQAIMFYHCSLDLLFSSFFLCLISDFAWPIVTKLCHIFDGDPDL